MANLSQQKRQRMLEFLQTIREEHKDDDDVLIAIGEIESELNAKKYGLVWEQHEEAVDVQMRDNIPVFTECADKEIFAAPGEKFNFLLEGDNLHSLRLLEKTHLGKIDLIYIDPPYNTGNQDFRYDDVYVDELDTYRHSKWLYHSGKYSMKFSKSIQRQLVEVQKDFMPEDTEAGQIQGFLEHYTGNMVCSKQLFKEALGHTFDEPKRWQLHNINEIMNTVVTGWKPFSNPRMFAGYGRQKGWERDTSGNELPSNEGGFVELSEEECRQLELPQEWIA